MKTLEDMLSKQLQDEEFKKEYDAIQPEMNEIRADIRRNSKSYKKLTFSIQSDTF